ncbi:MAG: hypothetical protein INR66_25195 [Gordonia polyisoprenivorans]|nr:hypothetical protein [Gordonia polyisoprenivorans]
MTATSWLHLSGRARVRVPDGWQHIGYFGQIATVVFPVVFLTDGRLTGRCVTGPYAKRCTSSTWFAPHWKVPANGVLLDWLDVSIPGPQHQEPRFPGTRGHAIVLARRPAKLYSGTATTSCPSSAASEIDLVIQRSRRGYPNSRLDMRACFGPRASLHTRQSVRYMIHSLQFRAHR